MIFKNITGKTSLLFTYTLTHRHTRGVEQVKKQQAAQEEGRRKKAKKFGTNNKVTKPATPTPPPSHTHTPLHTRPFPWSLELFIDFLQNIFEYFK
jgi:hypothetical protein